MINLTFLPFSNYAMQYEFLEKLVCYSRTNKTLLTNKEILTMDYFMGIYMSG